MPARRAESGAKVPDASFAPCGQKRRRRAPRKCSRLRDEVVADQVGRNQVILERLIAVFGEGNRVVSIHEPANVSVAVVVDELP